MSSADNQRLHNPDLEMGWTHATSSIPDTRRMDQLNVDRLPVTLLDLLVNSVILRQTAPYIPIQGVLALSRTCKSIREQVLTSPEVWRYLDLTKVRSAIIDSSPIDVGGVSWRAERMDEALTEDDFYSGPLRGVFGRLHQKHILRNVQVLVLDGLSVPADLIREIVAEDRYNVKILSIREAKNLNQAKLQQVLRYVVRPTRAEGTPKLKALYFFGPKDTAKSAACQQPSNSRTLAGSGGVMASEGAQIGAEWNQRSASALTTCLCDDETKWYSSTGRVLRRPQSDWADTLQVCKGLIAFDAVLCRGPRHDISKVESKDFLQPAIATVALGPKGCESCDICPEKPAVFGESPESALPLLSPPPSHGATVRAGQIPHFASNTYPKLILRCEECLRGRWCERCNRWWCEDCYQEPISRMHLRTELQQLEMREDLKQTGWQDGAGGGAIKVYSKLCVEHCLVSEMMSGAGSNGMWG